jgi:cathepsin L
MRVIIFALLAVSALARLAPLSENEYQSQFVDFTRQFSKVYNANEMFQKYNTFKYWVDFVRNHNAANHTWEAGINEFSDLSPEEFSAIYLSGLKVDDTPVQQHAEVDLSTLANDVDWRGKAVTPVKNQGQCGSCWAFSATGAMEGFSATKKGSLPNLSEQQLVDCSGSTGNQGCNGGWPSWAITYASRQGSCSQSAYPYTGRQGSCRQCSSTFKPSGAPTGSSENTLVAQLNNFPVSVAVDASGGFQSYRGGVFSGPCGSALNHAVLAVGYTGSYYIVKNSWGTSWGSGGYIMMARGKNLCGINQKLAWVS